MIPIGSPRVPSTCGSSLVTPVARNDDSDAGAHAACLASPATPACHAAAAPPHAKPCCRGRSECQRFPMCRLCHVLLLLSIAFCLHCLAFLRLLRMLPLLLRTTLFPRPTHTSLALSPSGGMLRAPEPSSGLGRTHGDVRCPGHPAAAATWCQKSRGLLLRFWHAVEKGHYFSCWQFLFTAFPDLQWQLSPMLAHWCLPPSVGRQKFHRDLAYWPRAALPGTTV